MKKLELFGMDGYNENNRIKENMDYILSDDPLTKESILTILSILRSFL